MYLARLTKTTSPIRFFTNERKAREWFRDIEHPKPARTSVSLVAGLFVGLIGLLALIGWKLNNPYLLRGLPDLQAMNPLAAVGLLVTGYGFICYWFGKLKQLKIAGVFGIVLGLVALFSVHDLPLAYFTDATQYDPLAALKRFKGPKLLAHATEDEFMKFDAVESIYADLPEPKMFVQLDCTHDYRLFPAAIRGSTTHLANVSTKRSSAEDISCLGESL